MNIHSQYISRLEALHKALGIPDDYVSTCTLPLCIEPEDLVNTELDYYGRPQRLIRDAFVAWTAMKQSATADGVDLFLISAFRDVEYQHDVIAKKLAAGRTIQEILQVNAAPGYSEHHTGRAIDIGTPGCPALEEQFEHTEAFKWLSSNGNKHNFFMSYPRGNNSQIDYEPWHWCFQKLEE